MIHSQPKKKPRTEKKHRIFWNFYRLMDMLSPGNSLFSINVTEGFWWFSVVFFVLFCFVVWLIVAGLFGFCCCLFVGVSSIKTKLCDHFYVSVPGNKDELLHIKHCREEMDYRVSSRVFGRHEQSSPESLHVFCLLSQHYSLLFLSGVFSCIQLLVNLLVFYKWQNY